MWTEVIHIVHTSDMHLCVDVAGNLRPVQEMSRLARLALWLAHRRWGTPIAHSLISGLYVHSDAALQALITTLHEITQISRTCPIAWVQTGDVEAFGGTFTQPGRVWEFPSLDFWDAINAKFAAQLNQISLYGNHDIWPSTFPLCRFWSVEDVERALRKRQLFSANLPDCLPIDAGKFDVEFIRLNTVQSHSLKNSLADGHISADRSKDVATALVNCVRNRPAKGGKSVIRVILTHHPPYFVNANKSKSLFGGKIDNVDVLSNALKKERFHLILSGHQHRAFSAPAPLPAHGNSQQKPPTDTAQFVVGSATQFTKSKRKEDRPSFSRYSIFAEDQLGLLQVERTIYYFLSDLDNRFTPEPRETIITDLKI